MDFKKFLKEKEEEVMNDENEEMKSKVVAIFTEGEPVTVETITVKAEEFEMEKEELENEVYSVLYDMLNIEDGDEEEEISSEDDMDTDDIENSDEEE